MATLALRALLMAMILVMPIQNAFRGAEVGLRGLNIANVLFALALAFVLARGSATKTPAPLKGRFFFFFALLVWGYCIGQLYDSSQWAGDLSELKNNLFYMLLFFLFYAAVSDLKTARILFATLLFITFYAIFLGMRQALDYGIASYNETRRVGAPFSWSYFDANRSAIYYCISLPLFAAVALFYKSRPMLRLFALGAVLLGVFVVFFTYSRQAYFIIAAVALLLTLRRSILMAILIVIALVNFEYWVPQTAIDRVQSTSQGDEFSAPPPGAEEGGRYDESTESRIVIWDGARQMIEAQPWGIGLNHFKRTIGAYVPQHSGKDAHNFYVLITAEAGIIAPFVLLLLLFGLYRLGRSVEKVDDTEESRVIGVGFAMSVVAVALGNIYGSRFLDGDVMANFWILSGLVARYRSLVLEAQQQAAQPLLPLGIPSALAVRGQATAVRSNAGGNIVV